MAIGTESGCINHPAIEAVGRCKQCGKPFCGTCRVQGPTGNFCSEDCKSKHEVFTQRAQQLDTMSRSGGFLNKLWFLGKKIIVFALFFLAVAVALHFIGLNVPVVSPVIRNIMGS
jgi:hypothetical protein